MRNRRSKSNKFKIRRICSATFFIIVIILSIYSLNKLVFYKKSDEKQLSTEPKEEVSPTLNQDIEKEESKKDKNLEVKEILISAAGDSTLGTDTNFAKSTSLPTMLQNHGNDYTYFMKNVEHIFKSDDYTLINLETTFTDATKKANKGSGTVFHFKGPKDYVNILTSSGIEGVTLANNHIYDYGQKGFDDTVESLRNANVDFCGEGFKILKEIKGVKFGFLGYQGWNDTEKLRNTIKNDINELRKNGAIVVIPYFHWGLEGKFKPIDTQINLARFSIDNGADMVLGAHPHVIQTLENYKGKLIAYSLSNFSFGGNSNPSDKRTFILQAKFNIQGNELKDYTFKVIPASISSVDYKNDYRPTPVEGEKKDSILKFMNDLSPTLKGSIKDDFTELNTN